MFLRIENSLPLLSIFFPSNNTIVVAVRAAISSTATAALHLLHHAVLSVSMLWTTTSETCCKLRGVPRGSGTDGTIHPDLLAWFVLGPDTALSTFPKIRGVVCQDSPCHLCHSQPKRRERTERAPPPRAVPSTPTQILRTAALAATRLSRAANRCKHRTIMFVIVPCRPRVPFGKGLKNCRGSKASSHGRFSLELGIRGGIVVVGLHCMGEGLWPLFGGSVWSAPE